MRKWIIATGAIASALLASGRAEAANCATVTFSAPTISGWNPLIRRQRDSARSRRQQRGSRPDRAIRSARIIFLDNDTGVHDKSERPVLNIDDQDIGGNNVASAQSGTAVTTSNSITQFSWGNGGSNRAVLRRSQFRVIPTSNRISSAGTTYSEALKYSIQCLTVRHAASPPLGSDTKSRRTNTIV